MCFNTSRSFLDPLNADLNPVRNLLAFVGARHIVHVSRIRVNVPFPPPNSNWKDLQPYSETDVFFISPKLWVLQFEHVVKDLKRERKTMLPYTDCLSAHGCLNSGCTWNFHYKEAQKSKKKKPAARNRNVQINKNLLTDRIPSSMQAVGKRVLKIEYSEQPFTKELSQDYFKSNSIIWYGEM